MRFSKAACFSFAALVAFAACNKKKDEPDPNATGPDCKMSGYAVYSPGGCQDSVSFLGDLDKMSGLLLFKNCTGVGGPFDGSSFTYDGDKIYVRDSTSTDKDTLFLEHGTMRIVEIHRDEMNVGPLATRYEYSVSGELQRAISGYDGIPRDTVSYTYANGDMILEVTNFTGQPDTSRYEYYLDKNLPDNGLFTQIFQRFGNAYVVKNAHLLKSYTYSQGRGLVSFNYEIDSYGNVSKAIRIENGRTVDSTVYHYACAMGQL
jgi:antitoxin component YwqK of YwqJK toxin-antitoxin module